MPRRLTLSIGPPAPSARTRSSASSRKDRGLKRSTPILMRCPSRSCAWLSICHLTIAGSARKPQARYSTNRPMAVRAGVLNSILRSRFFMVRGQGCNRHGAENRNEEANRVCGIATSIAGLGRPPWPRGVDGGHVPHRFGRAILSGARFVYSCSRYPTP